MSVEPVLAVNLTVEKDSHCTILRLWNECEEAIAEIELSDVAAEGLIDLLHRALKFDRKNDRRLSLL